LTELAVFASELALQSSTGAGAGSVSGSALANGIITAAHDATPMVANAPNRLRRAVGRVTRHCFDRRARFSHRVNKFSLWYSPI
jgi:hypothetical protein